QISCGAKELGSLVAISRDFSAYYLRMIEHTMSTRDNPIVSVIIPFHGTETDLRDCLGSLCRQSTQDFEVIIVADAIPVSADVADELRASGRPCRIIQNNTRTGPFASRRLGATFANGQYLWFVDHDDLTVPNFIALTLAAAQQTPAEIVECPVL